METIMMSKEELVEKNLDLLNENALLKSEMARIRLEGERKECRVEELEELCKDLQDQHQHDCIRYNDMRTAFLKAVDELVTLRKQFGVVR
jgi:DNA-binding Xre family transcriptional regulator